MAGVKNPEDFIKVGQRFYCSDKAFLIDKIDLSLKKGFGFLIIDEQPVAESSNDLVSCTKCNVINEYAQPNQTDGSYVCYSCRN